MNKLTKLTLDKVKHLESNSGAYEAKAPIVLKGDRMYMILCDHEGNDIEHNVIDHPVTASWQEEWQLLGKGGDVLFTFRPNETFPHKPSIRYTPDNNWMDIYITDMIQEVVRRAMEEQGAIFYYNNEEE